MRLPKTITLDYLNYVVWTDGKTMEDAWLAVFLLNEQAWAEKRWKDILTDDEICERFTKWFPDHNPCRPIRVVKARPRFIDTEQRIFYRYVVNEEGNGCMATPRGRVVIEGGPAGRRKERAAATKFVEPYDHKPGLRVKNARIKAEKERKAKGKKTGRPA